MKSPTLSILFCLLFVFGSAHQHLRHRATADSEATVNCKITVNAKLFNVKINDNTVTLGNSRSRYNPAIAKTFSFVPSMTYPTKISIYGKKSGSGSNDGCSTGGVALECSGPAAWNNFGMASPLWKARASSSFSRGDLTGDYSSGLCTSTSNVVLTGAQSAGTMKKWAASGLRYAQFEAVVPVSVFQPNTLYSPLFSFDAKVDGASVTFGCRTPLIAFARCVEFRGGVKKPGKLVYCGTTPVAFEPSMLGHTCYGRDFSMSTLSAPSGTSYLAVPQLKTVSQSSLNGPKLFTPSGGCFKTSAANYAGVSKVYGEKLAPGMLTKLCKVKSYNAEAPASSTLNLAMTGREFQGLTFGCSTGSQAATQGLADVCVQYAGSSRGTMASARVCDGKPFAVSDLPKMKGDGSLYPCSNVVAYIDVPMKFSMGRADKSGGHLALWRPVRAVYTWLNLHSSSIMFKAVHQGQPHCTYASQRISTISNNLMLVYTQSGTCKGEEKVCMTKKNDFLKSCYYDAQPLVSGNCQGSYKKIQLKLNDQWVCAKEKAGTSIFNIPPNPFRNRRYM